MFKADAARIEDAVQARARSIGYTVWGWLGLIAGGGLFLVAFFSGPEGGPPGVQTMLLLGGVPLAILGTLGSAALWVATIYRQRADDISAQALNDASEQAGNDTAKVAPFVLYLRPFDSTAKIQKEVLDASETRQVYELETQLSKAVRDVCQFVALGRSLEHVGAGRIETTDEEWQETALRLMERARLIFLVPVTNPGTLWEIDRILERGWMAKTILINVHEKKSLFTKNAFNQLEDWPALQARFAEAGFTLPGYDPSGRMIFFGDSRAPQVTERLKFESLGHLRKVMQHTNRLSGLK